MDNKVTNKFYGLQVWKKLSKQYKINNPLCVMCSNREIVRTAEYVDHKVPIEIDYELRLDVNNLQSLCAKCHAKKTNAVDVQMLKGKDAKPLSNSGTDGLPKDINHQWNK